MNRHSAPSVKLIPSLCASLQPAWWRKDASIIYLVMIEHT